MPWRCEQVHEILLPPARTSEEYAIHRAALEWSLSESIIIQTPEDIRSRVNWKDRLEPFQHQVQNLMTFCRRLPVALLADDVGLGKTISAGLILSELMTRRKVSRALVICPKILAPQWKQELAEKFGISARVAIGKEFSQEVKEQTPVLVTTYETARDHLKHMASRIFEMLILDEAHKLRNLYGTKNPPVMAQRIHSALEQRVFKYILMLTATPLQNRLWDLYSLIDCMIVAKGHPNPLGKPDDFQRKFIKPGSDGRKIQPERVEEFRAVLREYLTRTRRVDARLKFPTRDVRLWHVQLTPGERQLMELVGRHIAKLNPLMQSSLAQALMSSPAALATQVENMVKNRQLPEEALSEVKTALQAIKEPAKLSGLLALIRQLRTDKPRDWRVVVFTIRRETQELIGQALRREGIKWGSIKGGDSRANEKSQQEFRADPPQAHVLVSTDAGAEGINLQVANVLVNYDLPWNPMIVEQRIGRIQRLRSSHEYVNVVNLVASNTVEEKVVVRLVEKLQLIASAIGDIETILESIDQEDGEGESFEARIRDLVVKSLVGQDVTEATELHRHSIELAKRQIEECRQEMDQTLGHLDALHQAGPAMPRLAPSAPSVPAKDFVLRAKKAEGARVEQVKAEVFECWPPGRVKEIMVFDEAASVAAGLQGAFMGNAPQLYVPGKPAFERLTQYWVDRAGHFIRAFLRRMRPERNNSLANGVRNSPAWNLARQRLPRGRPIFKGSCRSKRNPRTAWTVLRSSFEGPSAQTTTRSVCLRTRSKWPSQTVLCPASFLRKSKVGWPASSRVTAMSTNFVSFTRLGCRKKRHAPGPTRIVWRRCAPISRRSFTPMLSEWKGLVTPRGPLQLNSRSKRWPMRRFWKQSRLWERSSRNRVGVFAV